MHTIWGTFAVGFQLMLVLLACDVALTLLLMLPNNCRAKQAKMQLLAGDPPLQEGHSCMGSCRDSGSKDVVGELLLCWTHSSVLSLLVA
jgi:hypothetical protein